MRITYSEALARMEYHGQGLFRKAVEDFRYSAGEKISGLLAGLIRRVRDCRPQRRERSAEERMNDEILYALAPIGGFVWAVIMIICLEYV